jgi:hypothetical protein
MHDRIPDVPHVNIRKLTMAEMIALARRRKGWSVGIAAATMRISKPTLIKREHGRGEVTETWNWWKTHCPEMLNGFGH